MKHDYTGFFQRWQDQYPQLELLTCWRQAKRLAKSFSDLESWLRPETDKLYVLAPGLVEEVKNLSQLEHLEQTLNGDMGIQCVRVLLRMLEGGHYEAAQRFRAVEGDPTRQFPELEPVLYRMFGCRLHGVQGCDGWLCQRPQKG